MEPRIDTDILKYEEKKVSRKGAKTQRKEKNLLSHRAHRGHRENERKAYFMFFTTKKRIARRCLERYSKIILLCVSFVASDHQQSRAVSNIIFLTARL